MDAKKRPWGRRLSCIRSIRPYGRGKSKSWSFVPYLIMYMFSHCGLTAEVNQGRGASPHTRPRRTARPILLGFSKTPLAKLYALVSGFVLIRKSLTLPMVHPVPRKLRRRPVCATRFSSTPFSNFAGDGELLWSRCCRLISKGQRATSSIFSICLLHFLVSFLGIT